MRARIFFDKFQHFKKIAVWALLWIWGTFLNLIKINMFLVTNIF